MDDEERLEGDEEMELDEASDGEDEDEEATGIPVSPANSDHLLGPAPTTPGNSEYIHCILINLYYQWFTSHHISMCNVIVKIIYHFRGSTKVCFSCSNPR